MISVPNVSSEHLPTATLLRAVGCWEVATAEQGGWEGLPKAPSLQEPQHGEHGLPGEHGLRSVVRSDRRSAIVGIANLATVGSSTLPVINLWTGYEVHYMIYLVKENI